MLLFETVNVALNLFGRSVDILLVILLARLWREVTRLRAVTHQLHLAVMRDGDGGNEEEAA